MLTAYKSAWDLLRDVKGKASVWAAAGAVSEELPAPEEKIDWPGNLCIEQEREAHFKFWKSLLVIETRNQIHKPQDLV